MISFALTTDQFLNGTKTVTRRLGWKSLTPGTTLMAVRKSMGLKLGEKVEKLGQIRVVSVRREPLYRIDIDDVISEGFRGMLPDDFINMFCMHMRVDRSDDVTRIEFERIADSIGKEVANA